MAKIKTEEMHLERHIKIKKQVFHTLFLHVRHGEILAVYLPFNGHDLTVTICISAFHQSD